LLNRARGGAWAGIADSAGTTGTGGRISLPPRGRRGRIGNGFDPGVAAMTGPLSRRAFPAAVAGGLVVASASAADDPNTPPAEPARDYPAPKFTPTFRKPLLGKTLVQDFVIYCHFKDELDMVKKLLEKEPALLNATQDWGGGDWESGLGGASHMGNRAIVEFLLSKGARIDLFCATMLGEFDVVKGILTATPTLIDSKGPHGISLHAHAKAGGKPSEAVLDYLQSIKKVDLKPIPFLKKPAAAPPRKPG